MALRRLFCTVAGFVLAASFGPLMPAPSPAKHMLFGGDRKQALVCPVIRDKWAVLVGVNDHLDRTIPRSPQALKNVELLGNAFKDPICGQFGFGHVLSITGEAATTDGITRALNDWLARKALPDDMIVIYFTGQSATGRTGDPLLLTYDSSSTNVETTALNIQSLMAALRSRTQSRNIVCLVDSSMPPKSGPIAPDLTRLSSVGVTVMAATSGNQQSLTNGVLGQSIFNHHLIEAIRINNGSMTLDEVFNYVRGSVLADAQQAFHQTQTPTLTMPVINPAARLLAFGTPPRTVAPKQLFDMGHPVERLAMERPELIPPRLGGKAIVITSRKQSAMAPLPPELQNLNRPPGAAAAGAGTAVATLGTAVVPTARLQDPVLAATNPVNGRAQVSGPLAAQQAQVQEPSGRRSQIQDSSGRPRAQAQAQDDSLDFGIYMDNMKREIRNAWRRPRGMENRRITTVFTITPDGRILNPQIVQSSGMLEADQTAIEALQTASPLAPLPGGYGNVDVKYVFDHTVTD